VEVLEIELSDPKISELTASEIEKKLPGWLKKKAGKLPVEMDGNPPFLELGPGATLRRL
jgi:hypothetical protein